VLSVLIFLFLSILALTYLPCNLDKNQSSLSGVLHWAWSLSLLQSIQQINLTQKNTTFVLLCSYSKIMSKTPQCLVSIISNFISMKIIFVICLKWRFHDVPSHSDPLVGSWNVHFQRNEKLSLDLLQSWIR
jgi:hypothetical protein